MKSTIDLFYEEYEEALAYSAERERIRRKVSKARRRRIRKAMGWHKPNSEER